MNLHRLLWVLSLVSSVASATTFFIKPFPEFVQDATHIVRGRLTSVRTEFGTNSNGAKTIYTFANLSIEEVLKGSLRTGPIVVRKTGGMIEGQGILVPGSPNFEEREEVVLFLGPENADHTFEVTGMELGQFTLTLKKGVPTLQGGILAYSVLKPDERPDAIGPGITVNQRSWTLKELRALAKKGPAAAADSERASLGSATASPSAPEGNLLKQQAPSPAANEVQPIPPPENPQAKIAGLLFGIGLTLLILFLYLRRR